MWCSALSCKLQGGQFDGACVAVHTQNSLFLGDLPGQHERHTNEDVWLQAHASWVRGTGLDARRAHVPAPSHLNISHVLLQVPHIAVVDLSST